MAPERELKGNHAFVPLQYHHGYLFIWIRILTIWQRERLSLTSFSNDRISISSFPSKAFILSCLLANLRKKGFCHIFSESWIRHNSFPEVPLEVSIYLRCLLYEMNLKELTQVMVFRTLLVPSADRQGPPWPPLSSACHWSRARKWSRVPLHTVPSRFASVLLIHQHPAW